MLQHIVAAQVLDLVRSMESLWPVVIEARSEEGPHRQRTAINRLRTLARIASSAGFSKGLGGPLKPLKTWQKSLGGVRDLDVAIGLLEPYTGEKAKRVRQGAEHLDARFRALRDEGAQSLAHAARGVAGAECREALERLELWARRRLAGPHGPAAPLAPDDLAATVRSIVCPVASDWETALHDVQTLATEQFLHAFRRRNKRLRDAAEFVALYVDDSWEATRADLQSLHKNLGDINDLDVLLAKVHTEAARLARDPSADSRRTVGDLGRLAARICRARQREFDALMQQWEMAWGVRDRLRRVFPG